jgi:hypothetical protein
VALSQSYGLWYWLVSISYMLLSGLAISFAVPGVLPIILGPELVSHFHICKAYPASCILRTTKQCGFIGNSDMYGLHVR